MGLNCKTIAEAARYILEKADGKPLSVKEITEFINKEKIYKKNPNLKSSSVRSILSNHQYFKSAGNGKYIIDIEHDFSINNSSTNLVRQFINGPCQFAFDVNTQVDLLFQCFKLWSPQKSKSNKMNRDEFIEILNKIDLNVGKVHPLADNSFPYTHGLEKIDDDGLVTVVFGITTPLISSVKTSLPVASSVNKDSSKETSSITRSSRINNESKLRWEHSDVQIYITENLRDEIQNDVRAFCRAVFFINKLANEYYNKNLRYSNPDRKPELKIIIGTKEEVARFRLDFKGIDESKSKCEIEKLKLKIINQISMGKMCNSMSSTQKSIHELAEKCIEYQNRNRYAYYRPINCKKEILHVYPVLNIEPEYIEEWKPLDEIKHKCAIDYESTPITSDFIMMPYDIDRDSVLKFTPQFYQAFYHELYHLEVYNKYRGNETINEGMPELYSELCYKQFMEGLVDRELSKQEAESFLTQYMNFRDNGGYKLYYDRIRNKLDFLFKLNSNPYTVLYKLMNQLTHLGQSAIIGTKHAENKLLKCGKAKITPKWEEVFEDCVYQIKKHHPK